MARSGLIVLSILAFAATQFNAAWGQGPSRAPSMAPPMMSPPMMVPSNAPEMMGPSASGAPPPTSDCQTVIINNLIGCLDFVTNSSVTAPAAECCTGLDTVVNSNPVCLCSFVGSNAGIEFGNDINETRSLELHGACNVTTPDPSLCALINGSPAPGPSMLAGGPVSPGRSPTVAGGSAKEAKGSRFKSCTGLLLAGLSVAIMIAF